jgi:hypothetical protein
MGCSGLDFGNIDIAVMLLAFLSHAGPCLPFSLQKKFVAVPHSTCTELREFLQQYITSMLSYPALVHYRYTISIVPVSFPAIPAQVHAHLPKLLFLNDLAAVIAISRQ